MGNFNAKIGKQKPQETFIDKFGMGNRNDRGDTLAEFSINNNLKITNTFFKKKSK
jgi:hypothetical protein